MATFKVGQRVRVVCETGPDDCSHLIGRETTILRIDTSDPDGCIYDVIFDGQIIGFRAAELAPLTDPDAEKFIERIKRMEREPRPLIKDPAPAWDHA